MRTPPIGGFGFNLNPPMRRGVAGQVRDGTMDVHINRLAEHLHDRLRRGESVEWGGRIWERSR